MIASIWPACTCFKICLNIKSDSRSSGIMLDIIAILALLRGNLLKVKSMGVFKIWSGFEEEKPK